MICCRNEHSLIVTAEQPLHSQMALYNLYNLLNRDGEVYYTESGGRGLRVETTPILTMIFEGGT